MSGFPAACNIAVHKLVAAPPAPIPSIHPPISTLPIYTYTILCQIMADDPDAEERVTAHSYGALDGSEASSDCWLIRLPPAIAEVWDSVPEGTDLGELVFRKGGGGGGGGSTGAAQGGAGGVATAAAAAAAAATKPSITVHVNESLLELAKQQRKQQRDPRAAKDSKSPSSNNNNNSSSKVGKPLPGVLPLHYELQAMTKKVPVLHPFSRNPANGSVKVWGVVSRTANLQVTQDVQYRALLKDRLVTSNITGSRYVKPVEAAESIMSHNPAAAAAAVAGLTSAGTAAPSTTATMSSHHPGNNPHLSASAAEKKTFGNAISRIGRRILEVQEQSSSSGSPLIQQGNAKRARQFAPDQPLRSVVFELFQLQDRWAVKDLRVAAISGGATLANAKKAEAEIRDILRDIGEYHRSGDYKNLWELKREFQTQQHPHPHSSGGAAAPSSSPSAGGGGAGATSGSPAARSSSAD
jgi:TFIIF, beta subunit HTH domain